MSGMPLIMIGNKEIGSAFEPFIIAEMSGNHNGSFERAMEIVDAAASAGAHALKLQTYTADSMTMDLKRDEFLIKDPKSLWFGYSLYDLYKKACTPRDWHDSIFKRCKEKGIICFSTPFDERAVDFLEELNTPAYKIASFENTDLKLIRRAASTGKPLIISTGMANVSEIEEAVNAAQDTGCKEIILLKCTSSYPANPENSNIKTLPHMKDLFGVQIGLSDHTVGVGASLAGIALGATVIEKHLTLSRSDGGVDAAFSLEPEEFKQLVIESKRTWMSIGEVNYGITEEEKNSKQFRRSLYISKDLKAGEVLSENNLKSIRPGLGLPPKYYDTVIGRKIAVDAKRGTPVSWDLLIK